MQLHDIIIDISARKVHDIIRRRDAEERMTSPGDRAAPGPVGIIARHRQRIRNTLCLLATHAASPPPPAAVPPHFKFPQLFLVLVLPRRAAPAAPKAKMSHFFVTLETKTTPSSEKGLIMPYRIPPSPDQSKIIAIPKPG